MTNAEFVENTTALVKQIDGAPTTTVDSQLISDDSFCAAIATRTGFLERRESIMGIKTLIVGGGAACTAFGLAPVAHADYTWTVQQICDAHSPGTVAMSIVASRDIGCTKPGSTPGFLDWAPQSIPRVMADFRPGSYSTDPGNPWADWIIPDGSQPKPPTRAPMVACDRINGQMVCGPQIPIPCSGPGAPCG